MRKIRKVLAAGILTACCIIGCGKQSQIQSGNNITSPVTITPTTAILTLAPSGEDISYYLSSSQAEESDEGKDGEFVYFQSGMSYPVFEDSRYAVQMNVFVERIIEEFRQGLTDAKENATLDYNDYKEGISQGIGFPYVEELTISCEWSKEELLVIYSQWYSNAGGVHPNTYSQAYVVDVTKGETISIEYILEPYGIATEELADYVADKIKEDYDEYLYVIENEEYYKNEIHEFLVNNQWAINSNGLVVFANPYDIAPYAFGIIECEIPYEVLEQGLKKK